MLAATLTRYVELHSSFAATVQLQCICGRGKHNGRTVVHVQINPLPFGAL